MICGGPEVFAIQLYMTALPRIARVPYTAKVPDACPYCGGHNVTRRGTRKKKLEIVQLWRCASWARASQTRPAFADVSRIIVNSKRNAATEAAALIHPGSGNNKLRHETLQRFMLINDSVTVAIEVPIWLTEEDITALEELHRIELAPRIGGAGRAITGHIDFLQVRNGAIHILDYKPNARTIKPIAQLGIYALALTRRCRAQELEPRRRHAAC